MKNLTYDEWLPYDTYEKNECDIKLHDGTILKHYYPNAGDFHACCDLQGTGQEIVKEADVAEIMYRNYYMENICNMAQYRCNDMPIKKKLRSIGIIGGGAEANAVAAAIALESHEPILIQHHDGPPPKSDFIDDQANIIMNNPYSAYVPLFEDEGPTATHSIRTEPKISRNAACPCNSGKKYKKCCLKTNSS